MEKAIIEEIGFIFGIMEAEHDKDRAKELIYSRLLKLKRKVRKKN